MSPTHPSPGGALRAFGAAALRVLLAALAAAALAPTAAGAAQPGTVSTNWAGYVALPARAGGSFSSVSGTWREPLPACARGQESFSATWVGLGGYREGANALEQVGTDADCTRSGRAVYSAWFELLPAPPVGVPIAVHAGDDLSASATVRGHGVTLRIRNLSTGARFSVTRRAATVDASSAEWIVEAPSICTGGSSCRTLQLADFGRTSFQSATATAGGHSGQAQDGSWSAREIEMRQGIYDVATNAGTPALAGTRMILATPSALTQPGGAFSVSWREQLAAGEEAPRPTLPG